MILAGILVWLLCHNRYSFRPEVLDGLFADRNTLSQRWSALQGLWPLPGVLLLTYFEAVLYLGLVKLAVYFLPRVPPTQGRLSWNYLFRNITSPYLRSEWDVIASRIGLQPNTNVLADVATKGGKILLGTLAGVATNADGSLRHLKLKDPRVRAKRAADTGGETKQEQDYVFADSFYFVVLAGDITDVNLRFERTGTDALAETRPATPEDTTGAAGKTQPVREQPLEAELTELDVTEREQLIRQLDTPTGSHDN